MRSIITLAGIDEAVSNLRYSEKALKYRLIQSIRAFYTDDISIETIMEIPSDALIQKLWETGHDPIAIRNRRKNLSSIKSSINADLNRLHEEGKNSEGIIIGPANVFDMSDEAKTKMLERFTYETSGNSPVPMSQIMEVLQTVNQILAGPDEGDGAGEKDGIEKLDQLREIIQSLARKVGLGDLPQPPANVASGGGPGPTVMDQIIGRGEGHAGGGKIGPGDGDGMMSRISEEGLSGGDLKNAKTGLDPVDTVFPEGSGIGSRSVVDSPNLEAAPEDSIVEEDVEEILIETEAEENITESFQIMDDFEVEDQMKEEDFEEDLEDEEVVEEQEASDELVEPDVDGEMEDVDQDEVINAGEAVETLEEDVLDDIDLEEDSEEVTFEEESEEFSGTLGELKEVYGEDDLEEAEIEEEEVLEEAEEPGDEAGLESGMDEGDVEPPLEADPDEVVEEELVAEEELDVVEPGSDMGGRGPFDEKMEEENTEGSTIKEDLEDQDIKEADADEYVEEVSESDDGLMDGSKMALDQEIDEALETLDLEEGAEEDLIEDELEDVDAEEEPEDVEILDEPESEEGMDDADDMEDLEVLPEDEDIEDKPEVVDMDEEPEEVVLEEGVDGLDISLADLLDEYSDEGFIGEDGIRKAKYLAEGFNHALAAMDKYYNQYILIPSGYYRVGAKTPKNNEIPLRRIHLESFYIGKFPVTNALFEVFVEKTGYQTTAERLGYGIVYHGRYQKVIDEKTGLETLNWQSSSSSDRVEGAYWYQPLGPGSTLHNKRNHPVVQVSREDAMAFAAWTGKRLPTEDEWEAAARTAKGLELPWGKTFDPAFCNIEESYIGDTTPVDQYKKYANKFGVMDTIGNVLEWTLDPISPSSEPVGEQRAAYIFKGGSWISGCDVRLYSRIIPGWETHSNIIGFRCVAY
ncbi:MAG: SUMF1/EgtB/PvdO family nonheme iron enzyme [Deltaproteobacteria bacterium]|nr:SUMF1/EgtB/PvdO family nonheme iron enzyme [Deltaproteobacteria bacterium]